MGPRPTPTGPLSARAFARWLRVDEAAVRKAIRTGRLERCLTRTNGHVRIADAALAEREWRENRDPAKTTTRPRAGRSTVATARKRVLDLQGEKLTLELALRRGDLVPAREAEDRRTAEIIRARTQLLALPTRAKQRLPHLTPADLIVLDVLVRDALEELAEGGS